MKKLVTLLITLVFFGCSKNSEDKPDEPPVVVVVDHEIVGKWQLIAYLDDDVMPFEWTPVTDGAIIEFKASGVFEINGDPMGECGSPITYTINQGTESTNGEILYYCEELLTKEELFSFNQENELLTKPPLGWVSFKYVRVSE